MCASIFRESGYLRNKIENKRMGTRNIDKTLTPVADRDERFRKEAASIPIILKLIKIQCRLYCESMFWGQNLKI